MNSIALPSVPMSLCPFSALDLQTVNNGYKVTYYEKSPSRGDMDHVESTRKEFVFTNTEFEKAVKKYKEISDCMMKYMNA